MSFADRIIEFNESLEISTKLPPGIGVMNPFRENPEALSVSSRFYKKYYDDDHSRFLILGINPGRFGAGVTGIPFTDSKRLESECKIKWTGHPTHETSSVFVYDVIKAFGGVEEFYNNFFINSISPLGFVKKDEKGKEKNFNYYDSKELTRAIEPFIIDSIKKIVEFGINTNICFCLGSNKNYSYLQDLNSKLKLFGTILPLEHPRYIMQYRSKRKQEYIEKYLESFNKISD